MTWDTEPEQPRTLLGQLDDVDVSSVTDGDSLIFVGGGWQPGRTGRVDYVDYGDDPNTPRPPFAELVFWSGSPLITPLEATEQDQLYIGAGGFV